MSRSSLAPQPHPLELIPLFRRWPQSRLRDLVYTLLWNSLIGLGLWLGEQGRSALPLALLGEMVLISNLIGFSIHACLVLLRRVRPAGGPRHSTWLGAVYAMALYVGCTLFGISAGILLLGKQSQVAPVLGRLVRQLPIGVVVAVSVTVVLAAIERRLVREKLAAIQQQKIAEAGQLLAEARLRALQAQIEPHFLYNTLANVVSLIGSEPDKARHMLERLIDFLRASLAASRAEQATVGAELDLAAAYLDVLGVRMGARLRWRIEADEASRGLAIAPMLIQPLVENAVMHGIEPKVEGGEIVVSARLLDANLCIEVSDDGAGLGTAAPRPGGGVGLSNLRERLRSLHGTGAQLQLLEHQPAGVISRLLLPLSLPLDEA